DVDGRNGASAGDSAGVKRAVGKKAGVVVIDEVVVARLAVGLDVVIKGSQIVANGLDSELRWVSAYGEVAVKVQVARIPIVGPGQRVGICDMGRRSRRLAASVGPEKGIARPEHDVVGTGAAHHGLMEVVAYGVLVCQRFKHRNVARLNVVERH